LAHDFNEADYVAEALLDSPLQLLQTLTEAANELNAEIRQQVISHHGDLLKQTSHIQLIEQKLQLVHKRIATLMSSVNRVKSEMLEPYERMRVLTIKLRNVQMVCDVLRKCVRVSHLLKRLRLQIRACQEHAKSGPSVVTRDLSKAAQILREIEQVLDEYDMSGIAMIDKQLQFISSVGTLIRKQGQVFLTKGIDAQNPSELGSALQIFFNLGELPDVVLGAMKRVELNFAMAIRQVLDVSTIHEQVRSRNAHQGSSSSSAPKNELRAALWGKMSEFADSLAVFVQQIANLQRVIVRKVDPISQVAFLDVCESTLRDTCAHTQLGDVKHNGTTDTTTAADMPPYLQDTPAELLIMHAFWTNITAVLSKEMTRACRESQFVKIILISDFPKLHNIFVEMFTRVQRSNIASSKPGIAFARFGQGVSGTAARQQLMQTIAVFRTGFLKRIMSQLTDPVKKIFAVANTAPKTSDISNFVTAVHSVLEMINESPDDLQSAVAQGIAKSIGIFVEDCRKMVDSKRHAVCVSQTESCSPSQRRNAALFGSLCHLDKGIALAQVRQMVPNLCTRAEGILRRAWTGLRGLCNDILAILVKYASAEMEKQLFRMHNEPLEDNTGGSVHSNYVRLVGYQIQNFTKKVVPLYQTPRASLDRRRDIVRHLSMLGTRVITVFVRCASLLHPLSEKTKLRLTSDMAQLEGFMHTLVPDQNRDAETFLMLRSFKKMLFADTASLADAKTTCDRDTIVAVHHLISRIPFRKRSNMQSCMPHDILGMSLEKYSQWLDSKLNDTMAHC
jgi:conserved oligomeric Golgi complex subunit 5